MKWLIIIFIIIIVADTGLLFKWPEGKANGWPLMTPVQGDDLSVQSVECNDKLGSVCYKPLPGNTVSTKSIPYSKYHSPYPGHYILSKLNCPAPWKRVGLEEVNTGINYECVFVRLCICVEGE